MSQIELKQVILIRADLKMRRGKEIAQGAHASMKVVLENLEHPDVKAWLASAFAKVVCSVSSEEELLKIVERAKAAGLITALIEDQGRTEFHGVVTPTSAAIGPAPIDSFQDLTDHLTLR